MEYSTMVMRSSIHTFLRHFHLFASASALLAFPFSVTVLLHPFSNLSLFFSSLSLIFSSFLLLLVKVSVIRTLGTYKGDPPPFSSAAVITFVYNNVMIIICVNFTAHFLLWSFSTCLRWLERPPLWRTLTCAVSSLPATVFCNLGLLVSAMEGKGSVGRGLEVARGRVVAAGVVALLGGLEMVGVQALFENRVGVGLVGGGRVMVLEAIFLVYIHSLVIVMDTVAGCMFLRRARPLLCSYFF